MKRITILIVLMAVALPSAVWSDSAPVVVGGIGGMNVVPIRNNQIRMVREVVDIDCGWTTYMVKVDFWFKNTTDQKQELQIGFPVECRPDFDDEEVIRKSARSFRVKWNGKPIKHSLGDLQHEIVRSRDQYCQWVFWSARFAPNEEATNQVCYTFPTWNVTSGSHGEEPNAYLKYILKTGAAWAEWIQSATVRIHYGHPVPLHLGDGETIPGRSDLTIYPKGYVLDKKTHTITWEFKNFKPDKDIYFGWGEVPDFAELDKKPFIFIKDAPVEQKEPANQK